MISTLIIEDEPLSVKHIAGIIARSCPLLEITGTADSVTEAFEQIHRLKPDLVFLDIELAGQNSLKLLDDLKHPEFELILVTAHDQYGIQAVKHNATDYILKPIDKMEFLNAVEKASKRIQLKKSAEASVNSGDLQKHPSGRLTLPSMNGLIFVDISKIAYCESEGRYTRFFLAEGARQILVSKNLGEYEAILPSDQFVRIHHHSIVNLRYIEKYVKGRGGYVIMHDGRQLSVSFRKKDSFLDKLGS